MHMHQPVAQQGDAGPMYRGLAGWSVRLLLFRCFVDRR